jgi:tRNA(Ser,Leu) C12 N-acetylase TAN1
MENWNIVISVYQSGFRRAIRMLRDLGPVQRSPYHNLLVMVAEDPMALLEIIESEAEIKPALYDAISRVAPAMRCFDFHSVEEFTEKARSILVEWIPQLAGRSFHIRLHHRGSKHHLRTPDVERFLDETLLDALKQTGRGGRISFSEPDMVIVIDTIDDRAGVALWTHEELAQHKLLRPD